MVVYGLEEQVEQLRRPGTSRLVRFAKLIAQQVP
jgi:hypothetical protein